MWILWHSNCERSYLWPTSPKLKFINKDTVELALGTCVRQKQGERMSGKQG